MPDAAAAAQSSTVPSAESAAWEVRQPSLIWGFRLGFCAGIRGGRLLQGKVKARVLWCLHRSLGPGSGVYTAAPS